MSEDAAENSPQRETVIDTYYKEELKGLEKAVESGGLRKLTSQYGEMFVLPLPTGGYPVAILVREMVVRAGDQVVMKRGDNETTVPISGFSIDKGNGEIQFNSSETNTPAIFRTNDIVKNNTATTRALDWKRQSLSSSSD